MTDYATELRQAALTLRAAAAYIDAHGYYIPLDRLGVEDPDFPCDPEWSCVDSDLPAGYHNYPDCLFPDEYDRHSPTPHTPAASEDGAIAYAAYGRINPDPIDDGSSAYRRYADAMTQLSMHYAPTGAGYGEWVYPESLSDTLRATAQECDLQADRETRLATNTDHNADL
jgi:hypothetical protein